MVQAVEVWSRGCLAKAMVPSLSAREGGRCRDVLQFAFDAFVAFFAAHGSYGLLTGKTAPTEPPKRLMLDYRRTKMVLYNGDDIHRLAGLESISGKYRPRFRRAVPACR
jgi:hypothetical protein